MIWADLLRWSLTQSLADLEVVMVSMVGTIQFTHNHRRLEDSPQAPKRSVPLNCNLVIPKAEDQ